MKRIFAKSKKVKVELSFQKLSGEAVAKWSKGTTKQQRFFLEFQRGKRPENKGCTTPCAITGSGPGACMLWRDTSDVVMTLPGHALSRKKPLKVILWQQFPEKELGRVCFNLAKYLPEQSHKVYMFPFIIPEEKPCDLYVRILCKTSPWAKATTDDEMTAESATDVSEDEDMIGRQATMAEEETLARQKPDARGAREETVARQKSEPTLQRVSSLVEEPARKASAASATSADTRRGREPPSYPRTRSQQGSDEEADRPKPSPQLFSKPLRQPSELDSPRESQASLDRRRPMPRPGYESYNRDQDRPRERSSRRDVESSEDEEFTGLVPKHQRASKPRPRRDERDRRPYEDDEDVESLASTVSRASEVPRRPPKPQPRRNYEDNDDIESLRSGASHASIRDYGERPRSSLETAEARGGRRNLDYDDEEDDRALRQKYVDRSDVRPSLRRDTSRDRFGERDDEDLSYRRKAGEQRERRDPYLPRERPAYEDDDLASLKSARSQRSTNSYREEREERPRASWRNEEDTVDPRIRLKPKNDGYRREPEAPRRGRDDDDELSERSYRTERSERSTRDWDRGGDDRRGRDRDRDRDRILPPDLAAALARSNQSGGARSEPISQRRPPPREETRSPELSPPDSEEEYGGKRGVPSGRKPGYAAFPSSAFEDEDWARTPKKPSSSALRGPGVQVEEWSSDEERQPRGRAKPPQGPPRQYGRGQPSRPVWEEDEEENFGPGARSRQRW